jgi:hypothetical protein
MKRITCLALATAFSLTANASADFRDRYIGINYSFSHLNYANTTIGPVSVKDIAANDLSGAEIYMGYLFNPYVGLQVGYTQTQHKSRDIVVSGRAVTTNVQLFGWSADVIGQLPFYTDTLMILASAGVVQDNFRGVAFGAKANEKIYLNQTDPRVGLGMQYQISPCVGIRLMGYYSWLQFNDPFGVKVTDDVVTGTLGVNFSF